MPLVFSLLLLIFFSFLLIKGTEFLVDALDRLSKKTKLGKFALTSILVALATSLPELFVCLAAALEKEQTLALGNILGSNIANLSLVVGGATLIGGSLSIFGAFYKKDLLAVFLAALLPIFLLLDNTLSRVDGLLLLLVFGIYNYTILAEKRPRKVKGEGTGILRRLNKTGTHKQIAWVFLGAAIVLFSADVIVKLASSIATEMNMSLILIGLFLVAIGTSLPELSFSIGAAKKKQVAMMFGDLIGSVVANATFILGLTALINPIRIQNVQVFYTATFFFIIIFLMFWYFVKTKRKLERWEAAALIAVYAIFVLVQFSNIKIF